MLFKSGKRIVTQAIKDNIYPDVINILLRRHLRGDWGDIPEEDKKSNQEALYYGGPILSGYFTGYGKIYIITEENRQATKIFFADEYRHMMAPKSLFEKALI
ncbi:MAG TPA: hypothetical protein VN426_04145 [Syntrophomonadaceae bacterium]|nr:hypothetical protein [Syntrophomonadaceae bacterium]